MRTAECLECIAETRARVDVPLVPMTYAAILEAYGYERFVADSRAAGATSAIVVDLPVEEHPEVPRIQLVAPDLDRRADRGSAPRAPTAGSTSSRSPARPAPAPRSPPPSPGSSSGPRALTDVPLYAGFGISTPEHAAAVAALADGVVVGSRAVQVAEEGPAALRDYVRALRERDRRRRGDAPDSEDRPAPSDLQALDSPRGRARARSPASRPSPSCSTARRRSTSSSGSPPRPPAKARSSLVVPGGIRPGLPVLGLGEGARGLGRARRDRGVRAARPRVVAVPGRGRGADRRRGARDTASGSSPASTRSTRRGPRRSTTRSSSTRPTARSPRKHRKLVPTNHERLIWGQGDGGGLRAIPTPLGRIGGLICWENYMPLARFALYESGVEIYVASTADDGDAWQATLVHIARESRAFVVSPSHFQRASAYPDDFPLRRARSRAPARSAAAARRSSRPAARTSPGRSTTRRGSSTPSSTRRVLWAERQRFDPAGHYHRPDVLALTVTPIES